MDIIINMCKSIKITFLCGHDVSGNIIFKYFSASKYMIFLVLELCVTKLPLVKKKKYRKNTNLSIRANKNRIKYNRERERSLKYFLLVEI